MLLTESVIEWQDLRNEQYREAQETLRRRIFGWGEGPLMYIVAPQPIPVPILIDDDPPWNGSLTYIGAPQPIPVPVPIDDSPWGDSISYIVAPQPIPIPVPIDDPPWWFQAAGWLPFAVKR
jgi:hypothetical protein